MKKFFTAVLLLMFVVTPLYALGPSFGIKGGIDNQSFSDYSNFNDDSLSGMWPSFGGLIELNIPLTPISVRGAGNFSWSSIDTTSVSDMNVSVSGKFSISPPLMPVGFYLGAGPSLHVLNLGENSNSNFGADFYTGLSLNLGINAFIEGGYSIMFPDSGSWSQINLKIGMML